MLGMGLRHGGCPFDRLVWFETDGPGLDWCYAPFTRASYFPIRAPLVTVACMSLTSCLAFNTNFPRCAVNNPNCFRMYAVEQVGILLNKGPRQLLAGFLRAP